MTAAPSPHVLDLFAVPGAVDALPGSGSVLAGDLVLSPGRDAATAEWLNPVLARLAVRIDERPAHASRGLRIAVPVPARDGSWVVEGWGAARYEPGTVACDDLDVVLATAHLLHAELAVAVPERPAALDRRTDRWARAERAAFGPPAALLDLVPDGPRATVTARVAAALAPEPPGTDQLVHADLDGNVLLDASGTPVVIDFSPAWRPPIWAEAVCAVDAVVRGSAAASALQRWTTPQGRQAVLRAVAFRVLSDPPGAESDYSSVLDSLGR
jgi:uncharacterized protein (TIGR02569 family)